MPHACINDCFRNLSVQPEPIRVVTPSCAVAAENAVQVPLDELALFSAEHAQARNRLEAALRAQVATAQGGDPYRYPDRLSAMIDREAGRAYLGEIDSALTEHAVLAPWGGKLPVPEQRHPHLARARRARV